MDYRIEHDTLGEVQVPADRLWGAQTERSLHNFAIGWERMPMEVIHAFALLKKACAKVNLAQNRLDAKRTELIVAACDEIIQDSYEDEFPLSVWQTGSGTQTNMNVNEVIANLGCRLAGPMAAEQRIHPNDHVNLSQSSNDTFPTVMHIAAVLILEERLLPSLTAMHKVLAAKADQFQDLIKIGRTHLQDATPLTLGQEISGWAAMIDASIRLLATSLASLHQLAIGGTAVGTGLNAPLNFDTEVCAELRRATGKAFVPASNKFHALTSHDSLVHASGGLKALAADLMKIANDVRWLASGPRCGIGEITIPANEPGSSIMPGKVNPTQAEAVTMVACQVMGNDVSIALGASQGNFELNVFKPLIIYNFLQSCTLLTDVITSFTKNCLMGLEPVCDQISKNLHNSLMLVTALNPHIGYENAARIAKKAHEEGTTLREAAMELGLLSGEEFDRIVVPKQMIGPTGE
jgi:fumarate hydratase, class II